MKKGIHPEMKLTVFYDASADFRFLTHSALKTTDKYKWEDGNEYPLVKLDISAASHPFYTGKMKLLDTEGRVDRFNRKYGKK